MACWGVAKRSGDEASWPIATYHRFDGHICFWRVHLVCFGGPGGRSRGDLAPGVVSWNFERGILFHALSGIQ